MFDRNEQIIFNFMNATKLAYANKEITSEEIVKRMKRINQLKSKYNQWKKQKEKLKYRKDRILRHFTESLKENAKFVAIDTGYDFKTGILNNVAVTLFENGVYTTQLFNLKDESFENIQSMCQTFCENSDFTIFHAAHADLNKLKLTTTRFRYFDTSFLAWHWIKSGDSPSLRELCNIFGIDSTGWHETAVDSRLTLELFFKMRENYWKTWRKLKFNAELPLETKNKFEFFDPILCDSITNHARKSVVDNMTEM